jgi:hypothetical protein
MPVIGFLNGGRKQTRRSWREAEFRMHHLGCSHFASGSHVLSITSFASTGSRCGPISC